MQIFRMGAGRVSYDLRGRGLGDLRGFVGALASAFRGRAVSTLGHPVWDADINGFFLVVSGVFGAIGGSIAGLVAWACRTGLVRPPDTGGSMLLAASTVLVGARLSAGLYMTWFSEHQTP